MMKRNFAILLTLMVAPLAAHARWAELHYSPDETNEYGVTIQVAPQDLTNGIQFSIKLSSSFTNSLPQQLDQIRVHKLSSGQLASSDIQFRNQTNSVHVVFVLPRDELDKAEFMWIRPYQGTAKIFGGSFNRVNLKKWYEFHRTTL